MSSQITSQGTTIEDELRAMILMSNLPSSWETFVTTVQRFNDNPQVLRSHECNPDKSSSEKVFHQRLGRRSLRSTRFDRPIEQSGKKFFPTTDKSAKPKQVPGNLNLQLLQETGTHQGRLLGTKVKGVTGMRRSTTSALQSRY